MAAVPEVGRATGVEHRVAPEAAATQDLYERYARQIFSFCLHRLGNREEAEDAVQQTFLNAFRGLRRGIDVEAESAWLFKIAHNVCLTRRRSAWRRGKVETPNDMEALQEFVAAPQQLGTDDLIQLQDALAAMPSNQRKAILLREWQGLSYHEIAEQMELSQPAVETLIFRARRTLAHGLEQRAEERRGWRRLRHTLDIGAVLAALKATLLGGAAAKVAATTVAVTAAAVVPAGIEQSRLRAEPAVSSERHVLAVADEPIARPPVPLVVEEDAPKASVTPKPRRLPAPAAPQPAEAAAEPPSAPAPVTKAPSPTPVPPAEPGPQHPEAAAPVAEAASAPVAPVPVEHPATEPNEVTAAGDHEDGHDGRTTQGVTDTGSKETELVTDHPIVEQPPAPAVEAPVEAPVASEPDLEHGGGKPGKPDKK